MADTNATSAGEYVVAPVVSMRINTISCMPSAGTMYASKIEAAVDRLRTLAQWNDVNRDRLCHALYAAVRETPAHLVRRVVLPL